ncbi:hypothetical protein HW115_17415 [Verrucomicrobiaceae bacterium N1E253]|uniref:Alkyl hydroperoxide reductase subunit C/ Thiol specific antioxidant domain-containing protein n=1 Tax=Oceaniferula marina TaxID=2748318 RepID=A0A851GK64_9BACT|nr:hypothetical protein [Oceaniferula marina]NWK57402.1 hypothetical protein [Oceaniferula marina]
MSDLSILLQARLDRIRDDLNRQIPAEAQKLMHDSTQALIDSGQAAKACSEGEQIPVFSLANQNGAQVSVSELYGEGPLVVSFFRGFW